MKKYLAGFWGLLALVFSCASPPEPAPPEEPGGHISFDRREASSPGDVTLFFFLDLENPREEDARVSVEPAPPVINGAELPGGKYRLAIPEEILLEAAGEKRTPFSVELDVRDFLEAGGDSREFKAELPLDLVYTYRNGPPLPKRISGSAAFPRIREPVFHITSIAVRQAELINTRLLVKLKIDNPNPFPMALSAFSYELFGAGRFWADGKLQDVLHIPPEASAGTDLHLIMNFINMKRELLDQVIAMEHVRYRFLGKAEVAFDTGFLPGFPISFDRSGDSPVVK